MSECSMQDIKETHVLLKSYTDSIPHGTKLIMQKNEKNTMIGQVFNNNNFHKPIVLPNRCYNVTFIEYNTSATPDYYGNKQYEITLEYDDTHEKITILESNISTNNDYLKDYSLYILKSVYDKIKDDYHTNRENIIKNYTPEQIKQAAYKASTSEINMNQSAVKDPAGGGMDDDDKLYLVRWKSDYKSLVNDDNIYYIEKTYNNDNIFTRFINRNNEDTKQIPVRLIKYIDGDKEDNDQLSFTDITNGQPMVIPLTQMYYQKNLKINPDINTGNYKLWIPHNIKIQREEALKNVRVKQTPIDDSFFGRGGGYRKSRKQKSKKRSTRRVRKSKTLKKKSRKTRRR